MPLQEELKRQGEFLFRYRSHLPLLLLSTGLLVKVQMELYGGAASESWSAEALEAVGPIVGALGLAIRALTVGFTPRDTSGRNAAQGQVAETLNTTGTYSLVRNPLYLGNYLMWISVAMVTGSIWFVMLATLSFWIYYERIVFAEEHFLRRKFGRQYVAWASQTPPFVPSRVRLTRPKMQFSWRKVAKQEKNGLFALCLLLCLFGIAGDLAAGELSFTEEYVSISATIASGVLYYALRALKRHTTLLDEEGR